MEFETQQVIGRKITANDKNLYAKIYGDIETMKYIGKPLSNADVERTWEVSLKQEKMSPIVRRTWALVEKTSNNNIGIAAFGLEKDQDKVATIGCMFIVGAQGKGYATEVLRKVTELAFKKYQINKLISYSMFTNIASYKLMTKLGYQYDKVTKNSNLVASGYYWYLTKRLWSKTVRSS